MAELDQKAVEAKKKAFNEEIKRIEGEISAQADAAIRKRIAEEEKTLQDTLQKTSSEIQVSLDAIQKRKTDVLKKLEPERKKKVEARKRLEEEKKKKDEAERKQREVEEKKRKEEEEKRRKQEREDQIHAAIEQIRTLFQGGDLDGALSLTHETFSLDHGNSDLKAWDHRIKEAKQKKIRDEEAALEIAKKKAQEQRKQKAKKTYLIAAVIILAIVAVVIYQYKKEIFPQAVNIAILPLNSTVKNITVENFGSSISREVGERLSSFKSVTVLGHSSAEEISEHYKEPSKILNKLGFAFILKGTVSEKAGAYAVEVKVIDSTNEEIWSHIIESPQNNFIDLPGEIAVELAKAMGVNVSEDIEKVIRKNGTKNSEAYIQYLDGMDQLEKHTAESSLKAYSLFVKASSLDPAFSDAAAGAVLALLLRNSMQWDNTDSSLKLTDRYIQKASSGKSSLAKIAQGRFSLSRKKLQEALQSFESVLSSSPRRSEALMGKAEVQIQLGRYDDAIANMMKAYESNPRDPMVLRALCFSMQIRGKIRDAMKYQEIAVQFSNDSTQYLIDNTVDAVLSDPDLLIGLGQRILSACDRALDGNPRNYKTLYRKAQVLQVLGKIPEANQPLFKIRAMLQDQLIRNPYDAEAMAYLGLALTRLGQFPEASNILQKAVSAGRNNPDVMYKVAEAYAMQIASYRGGKIDAGKKSQSLRYLRDAISLEYRLDELTNGDFFNLKAHPEFLQTIQLPLK